MPFWAWNVAAWIALGVFGGTQTLIVMRAQGQYHPWAPVLASQILSWTPWALATPLLAAFTRRKAPLVVHAAALVAMDAVWAAGSAMLERTLNPWGMVMAPFPRLVLVRAEAGALQTVLIYTVIAGTAYAFQARDRLVSREAEAARLNEQLTQARLQALQQQLEPHFLFNALHAVGGLVREGERTAAVQAIANLSDCLRRLLHEADAQVVPLRRELEFLDKYLDLQKLRFGDALRVDIDVPDDLLACEVPSVVLQPIVDNAIKHGISRRVGGGAVRIAAARANGTLTLRVYNDGPPLDTPAGAPGIGFANLRARLGMLYGSDSALSIDNEKGGVLVVLSMPARS
jgi:hypothetical protein